jgi:phage terminase large subunit-like protein
VTPIWTTACPDWADRLRAGRSIIPAPLFPEEAEAGLAVMRELKIVDAPGSPTIEEACAPWVFDLAASIFGSYDSRQGSETEGRRLITEWFVVLPKKNSKSTIAAAIMLTALIRNWRESAEFISLAPTLEIAGNSYAPSRDMVKKDAVLDDLMLVQTHLKTITNRRNGGTLKVVAADSNTVGGKRRSGY